MKNQINALKSDLKDSSIPPSLKVAIQADLDKATEIYNTRLLHTDEENSYDIMIAFARLNENIFHGKLEIRDLLVRVLNLGQTNA